MRTLISTSVLMLIIVIASCSPKVEANGEQELFDSLLSVNQAAYNSGDAQKIADLFTEDALLIANGKYIWTKDSILSATSWYAPILKNFKAYLGPTTISENIIQMQKFFTADVVMETSTLKGKGIAFIVWQKQPDNSWKIVTEIEDYSTK